ncbi:MAG: ATP-binding protein [Anaerolineales bacterium]|nr:ATP-binding protein [Anaerolineales bacterium]MDW8161860.1 ATP-binding protein [Anaerolineales bacterium]
MSTQSERKEKIGYIVGGGLRENLRARLSVPAAQVQEGSFVTVYSGNWVFYGLVTDLQLGATDPRFADEPTGARFPPEIAQSLLGQTLFTNIEILPVLMVERGPDPGSEAYRNWRTEIESGLRPEPGILPVKTVPNHHADVYLADAGDIAEIFGDPQEEMNFVVGYTREGNHPVCLNLDRFVQRSAGVFGATGTGKSFLTRLLLAGLIRRNRASVLVFDMHNEYGFDDVASDSGLRVRGLRDAFPARVRVAGLGRASTIRGRAPDFHLEIAMKDIRPVDIELLSGVLNLRETTPTTLEALVSSFGVEEWFRAFRAMRNGAVVETEEGKRVPAPDSVAAWANRTGVHPLAAEGLHSKLSMLFHRDYIVEQPATDSVGELVRMLEQGQHVVLSFGKYEQDVDYLFVSNLLTRRIREVWEKRTDRYRTTGTGEPRPLVIVLEEAHKLLNRELAGQTTFSTIAREMRKYYVTLLIVDQRPSQIYDEVMSQLGTRISGWLGDEDDIRAVLAGLAGRETLRGMLTHLQPREEVLLLGWGVPMPIPLRSRKYDERFWQELRRGDFELSGAKQAIRELGFENEG